MEDIFQFLIFAAFAAFGIIQTIKDKKKSEIQIPEDNETTEEAFPEMEFGEYIPQTTKPVEQQTTFHTPYFTEGSSSIRPSRVTAKPMRSKPQQHSKEKIKLDNRKEARKAFIYSEIFNRKY